MASSLLHTGTCTCRHYASFPLGEYKRRISWLLVAPMHNGNKRNVDGYGMGVEVGWRIIIT